METRKKTNYDRNLDGVLLIYKPAGMTSHDVVHHVRKAFRLKKVGHCGTLDPSATGLLALVLGKATKLSNRLMASDKLYAGAMKFGETTNTYDAEGQMEMSLPVPDDLSVDSLNSIAEEFWGDLLQVPPMVSAIKKDGVPLYKLARKGITIEREPRLTHVYDFYFTKYEAPVAEFKVFCSKGFYVRSLAHDFGEKIGCGAHLCGLRRLRSGSFKISAAHYLEDVLEDTFLELEERVISITEVARMLVETKK